MKIKAVNSAEIQFSINVDTEDLDFYRYQKHRNSFTINNFVVHESSPRYTHYRKVLTLGISWDFIYLSSISLRQEP